MRRLHVDRGLGHFGYPRDHRSIRSAVAVSRSVAGSRSCSQARARLTRRGAPRRWRSRRVRHSPFRIRSRFPILASSLASAEVSVAAADRRGTVQAIPSPSLIQAAPKVGSPSTVGRGALRVKFLSSLVQFPHRLFVDGLFAARRLADRVPVIARPEGQAGQKKIVRTKEKSSRLNRIHRMTCALPSRAPWRSSAGADPGSP